MDIFEAIRRGDKLEFETALSQTKILNLATADQFRETPLHLAARVADEDLGSDMIETLLRSGAELNIGDAHGRTPLHVAVGRGSLKLVQLLIRHGADPLLKDASGRSPRDLTQDPQILAATSLRSVREALGGVPGGEDDLP